MSTYRIAVKYWDRHYGDGHIQFRQSFEARRSAKADKEAIDILENALKTHSKPQGRIAEAWAERSDRGYPTMLRKYDGTSGSWVRVNPIRPAAQENNMQERRLGFATESHRYPQPEPPQHHVTRRYDTNEARRSRSHKFFIHTRANGFPRWVCVSTAATRSEAEAEVERLRQQDDPMWATAEYLITDTRTPSSSTPANVNEARGVNERNPIFERGFAHAVRMYNSKKSLESITHDKRYDATAFGRGMFAAVEAISGSYNIAEREARAWGYSSEEAKTLAYSVNDYNSANYTPRRQGEVRETHHVADFNTLDDLIAHARDELGATHVLFVDEEIHLYFPRRDGTFEKAEIWQKDGYWHAQGPGARAIVQEVPTGAQPIGGGRGQRAAEAQESKRDQVPTLPVIFRAERSGEHKGQVTAVFPTLPGTGPHDFTVYDGQHSVGSAGRYNNTRAATPSEYSRLLADLRNIYENDPDGPVKLHVVERFSHRYDIARRREWETTYRGGPQETTEFSAVHDHEAGGGRGQGVEASSAGRDTIPIAPGIEVRRMGQIEGAGYRWIDGWAVFVDGREHQPWMRKNDALRLARQFAQDRKSRTVRDYEAVDNRDRRIAGPFKHYGDAKTAAGPGGHVKYVRPRRASEARRPAKKSEALEAGKQYASEQLQSEHFDTWVWDQLSEAEKMRKKDPSSVHPLETDADFKRAARRMLQQLEWDAQRDFRTNPPSKDPEFYEGFREELRSDYARDWLAEVIADYNAQIRGTNRQQLPLPGVQAKAPRRPKAKRSARKKRK